MLAIQFVFVAYIMKLMKKDIILVVPSRGAI